MEPIDFIGEIANQYKHACNTHINHTKIQRGRSHSISSIAEDLFAFFLTQRIPTIEKILIDQPITIPTTKLPNKSSFQIYPDLAIIKEGQVSNLLDLKTDLGWNRDGLVDKAKKHLRTVELAKGHTAKFRDGKTQEKQVIQFSDKLKHSIVIISGENINRKKLQSQILEVKAISKLIDIFVLSSGVHPNEYWRLCPTYQSNLKIHYDEIEALEDLIK